MACSPSRRAAVADARGWPEAARLDERERIARDLHDTVLQTILGTRMLAENALAANDVEQLRQAMAKVVRWMDRAMLEGRETLGLLRRTAPEDDALVSLLRREIEDPLAAHLRPVTLHVSGESRTLAAHVRREAARIGAEAMRNARLHARAQSIRVELTYGDGLTLRVRDDGVGCPAIVVRAGRAGHYGLLGMRERAARIGASLDIASSASGTCVTLEVPAHAAYPLRARRGSGRPAMTL